MNDLIAQLQECKRTKIAAKNVFGKYGLHFEEDVTKSLGLLTPQHAMTQVTTWVLLHLEQRESTEIRLTNPTTKDVDTVVIEHTMKRGLMIKNIINEPKLTGKVLHHWHMHVTCETLSLIEIKASIECADTLNSFNDDLMDREIDDLVNEAIALELPMYDENIFNVMCEQCGVPEYEIDMSEDATPHRHQCKVSGSKPHDQNADQADTALWTNCPE